MSKGKTLRHVSNGAARMVDVSDTAVTVRLATAEAWVVLGAAVAEALRDRGGLAKGNVLETARLAGIMAAKRTAELIPMCHPLTLDGASSTASAGE